MTTAHMEKIETLLTTFTNDELMEAGAILARRLRESAQRLVRTIDRQDWTDWFHAETDHIDTYNRLVAVIEEQKRRSETKVTEPV